MMNRLILSAACLLTIALFSCGDGMSEKPIIEVQYLESAGEETKTVANILIEGVHCDGCRGKIKKELAALECVSVAGFTESTSQDQLALALVEFDPAKCEANQLIDVVNTIVDGKYTVQEMQVISLKAE